MDRGQTQTPQERFGSGREIKTSRASSLLCEDRAVYQRTLFFLSKQASFYIIFVVVVVFVRLSFSFFSGDCRYTQDEREGCMRNSAGK